VASTGRMAEPSVPPNANAHQRIGDDAQDRPPVWCCEPLTHLLELGHLVRNERNHVLLRQLRLQQGTATRTAPQPRPRDVTE
jgi:hypothetical protein